MRGETRQTADQAGWETVHPAGASSAANRRLLSRPNLAFPAADWKRLRQLMVVRDMSCVGQQVDGFEKVFSLKAMFPVNANSVCKLDMTLPLLSSRQILSAC